MEFDEGKPIYAQIADMVREGVLQGTWDEEERIPSIREMAVETEVNPNTVTRTYSLLQEQGVVYNRRGIGYFIASGAREKTKDIMRDEFIENELPAFFRKLEVLGLTVAEVAELYEKQREESEHEDE